MRHIIIRFVIIALSLSLIACSTHYPNNNILGQQMINVRGENLNDNPINLPKDLLENQLLMLIGYKQESQFDIDRWLIGLDMTHTKISVVEIPAIQGFFPRLIKNTINDGMRKGIPEELWKIVITVYEDGEKLLKFTGNDNPNNARVILINNQNKVSFFYDRGFSVNALNQLKAMIKENDQ